LKNANAILKDIFYNVFAEEILEFICGSCKSSDSVKIILFDRRYDNFVRYSPMGVFIPLDESNPADKIILKYANDYFFRNESVIIKELNSCIAIISANMFSIGYLQISLEKGEDEDEDEDKVADTGVDIPEMSLQVLEHYGALYGHIVMRNINNNLKFINNSKNRNSFESIINPYIPLGENKFCTTVFVDIRGLSGIIEKDKNNYIVFLNQFSTMVRDISSRHFGCVNGHFGGGLLITFYQLCNEEDGFSNIRAACAIRKIQDEFMHMVGKEYSNDSFELKNSLFIGIGSSMGISYYSTFDVGAGFFYTPLGIEVGKAKKIERLSGSGENREYIPLASNEFIKPFVKKDSKVAGVVDFELRDDINLYEIKGVKCEICPIPRADDSRCCLDCLSNRNNLLNQGNANPDAKNI